MLQKSPLYAYLPARDLARASRFYEGTLGFVPKSLINGGVTCEFAGGTAAFLYPTDNAGTSRASQAFWAVEDVDREMTELKARGDPLARVPAQATLPACVIATGATRRRSSTPAGHHGLALAHAWCRARVRPATDRYPGLFTRLGP